MSSASDAAKNVVAEAWRDEREVASGRELSASLGSGMGGGRAETVVRVWGRRGRESTSTVGGSVGGARMDNRSSADDNSPLAALFARTGMSS